MLELKETSFGGIIINIPKVWNIETEQYAEPDG